MQPAPHSINGYWINLILVLLLNTSRLFQLVRFLLHQEAAKFRKLLHPGLFLLLLGPRALGAPWLVSHSSVSMALVRHLWKANWLKWSAQAAHHHKHHHYFQLKTLIIQGWDPKKRFLSRFFKTNQNLH